LIHFYKREYFKLTEEEENLETTVMLEAKLGGL